MNVGYHASHEQFTPAELLSFVTRAEAAGFQAAMCSDHLAPFSMRQGQSGFAWSWLGAALASTGLSFGTVNAPGQRYHPVIIAQAIATLSQMFPDRFWVALGSGQFVNEHVTGERWPAKAERNERLRECVDIVRALLRGETVNHRGAVVASEARLYTLPVVQPRIFAAAVSVETASWAAPWADGLITVFQPGGRMEETIRAFRASGGSGKPVFLQAQHAFAPTDEEARAGAHDQWASSILGSDVTTELRTPEQIDDASSLARMEDILERVRTSADPAQHLEWLREYESLGIETVYVHNVSRHQHEFINAFGEHVLGEFAGRGRDDR